LKNNMGNRRWHTFIYCVFDYFSAVAAWVVFYFLWKIWIERPTLDLPSILNDQTFLRGVLFVPIAWSLLYALFDERNDVYRLSRLKTFGRTFWMSLIGSIILYFILLYQPASDNSGKPYFGVLLLLFLTHFCITAFVRMWQLTLASQRIKTGTITFNTLIIGGDQNALDMYLDIFNRKKPLGYLFVGFIDVGSKQNDNKLENLLPKLGGIKDIREVIDQQQVEEVIIATERAEQGRMEGIMDALTDTKQKVLIKIIPDMYDILIGTVRMNYPFGAVLIEVKQGLIAPWQAIVKRGMDVLAGLVGLVFCAPLMAYAAVRVKMSSQGGILYRQERVGINGKIFTIYKFRSMYMDAESEGPMLSSENDDRCTPWGKTMRKWRLDELPQFWNVLKGDMSLVGPRPERQFYIDQITRIAPHYKHLLRVRPGITSWGQVKYGYASTVEQMVQRLRYDILYIENMSISLDIKIIFYTLLVLVKGQGR
jgi:exopolysaccharide biosynthesis polyprenyl glycosylphosphotransferase